MDNADCERNLSDRIEEIIKDEKLRNANIMIKDAERGGFLSQANLITVEGEEENGKIRTLHLFLKHIPKGEVMRQQIPLREIYTTEIYLYNTVFPRLFQFQDEREVSNPFLSVAKFYNYCEVEHSELLIFEDLSSEGYTMWEKTKPMTNEMIIFVIKEYAKFHALSWALKDRNRYEFDDLTKCLTYDFMVMLVETYSDVVCEGYRDSLQCIDPEKEKQAFEALSALLPNPWQTLEDAEPEESVIIHGDSWCNNFMFLFEDSNKPSTIKKVAFLDWQLSTLASPVIDLSYFIYCNGSKEIFDNLEDYLKIYYEYLSSVTTELGSNIEDLFPYLKLQEHWKKYSKFGLLMSCEVFRITYKFDKQIPDFSEHVENEGNLDELFRGSCAQDPLFRERIRNVYLHFVKNKFI